MRPLAVTFAHCAQSTDPVLVDACLGGRTAVANHLDRSGTSSDEDLIAAADRRWGAAAPDHLNGAFAYAIRAQHPRGAGDRHTVRLARDVTGQVPLYYAIVEQGVIASTDLGAIVADPVVPDTPDTIDRDALAALYAHDYRTWLRRTGLRHVAKVPPGCMVEITAGTVRETQYWAPEDVAEDRSGRSRDDLLDELDTTLRAVVADSLAGHPKVGAHLSGGLDSALVAAVASSLPDCEITQAFSWAPAVDDVEPQPADERDRVRHIARHLGVPVTFHPAAPAVALTDWDPVLRPRLSLTREQHTLDRAAAAGITLILSGWGGDEAFCGPRAKPQLKRAGRLSLPRPKWLRANASSEFPVAQRIEEVWGATWPQVAACAAAGLRTVGTTRSARLQRIAWLQHGHLAARNESWFAAARPAGIRYAFPLQDRRLLELTLSAPDRITTDPTWNRVLIRQLVERYLPADIAWTRHAKRQPAQDRLPVGGVRPRSTPIDDILDVRDQLVPVARRRVR